jgi:N-acetylglucosaminyldiphosphoundecaprenol N-acetyl-beta-D-mannosaminyltransferase
LVEVLNTIKNTLKKNEKKSLYICASSVHGIIESQKDLELKEILNNAFINHPDGLPLVKMGRLLGEKKMEQIKGPKLFPAICEMTSSMNVRHFFYGGKEGVADKLANKMAKKYPGLKLAGTYCPPFRSLRENEKNKIINAINKFRADVVWVGLSSPKQEKWIGEFHKKIKVKLIFSVGAAFDFHTGNIIFAPLWMQKIGLEWFYRLIKEPKRLWKRYFKIIPPFMFFSILQLTGLKKFQ